MPDDKRLDLSQNLDGLLSDIAAATDEVKQRKAAERAKEVKSVQKTKSTKMQMIIAGVATVVIIFIAYFVVFAKPSTPVNNGGTTAISNLTVRNAKQKPIGFRNGTSTYSTPGTSRPMTMPMRTMTRHSSQVMQHPATGGTQDEQPGM